MDIQLQSASWLELAKRLPMPILQRSPVLSMGYGWALLDRGDLEGCGVWFDTAQDLHDRYQSAKGPENMLISDILQFDLLPATVASARAYIAAATDNMEGVFKHTHDALALIPSGQYQKRGIVTMLLAIAYWGLGELNEAEAAIIESLADAKRVGNPLICNSLYMVLGELYIQQGCLEKASALLNETITRVAQENQVPILLASLYLGLAKAAFLGGENQLAYALLEDSKIHAQKFALEDWEYRYYLMLARVYCREGFVDLARDCLRESKAHYFLSLIPDDLSFEDLETMIDRAAVPVHPAQLSKEHANRSLPEPLTVRELEVLALIASGSSNQEICNTLFLALSTVKGHNQAIYGKLQVKRRTEAVAKATALGLI